MFEGTLFRAILALVFVALTTNAQTLASFETITFNAADMGHNFGKASGSTAWASDGSNKGCMLYGPYLKTLPLSSTLAYLVTFTMSQPGLAAGTALGTLDITDGVRTPSSVAITAADLPVANQPYGLKFTFVQSVVSASGYEFRMCGNTPNNVIIYSVTIERYLPVRLLGNGGGFSHSYGVASGTTWIGSCCSSGAMQYGPYATDLIPYGAVRVEFWLSVDNNGASSGAASLDVVYGGGSPTTLNINRNQFSASNTPQMFAIVLSNNLWNGLKAGFEFRVWSWSPATCTVTMHYTMVCAAISSQPCSSQWPVTTTPTLAPTQRPSLSPTLTPTLRPSFSPTLAPSRQPSSAPTLSPTLAPTAAPTKSPTGIPTFAPTFGSTAPSTVFSLQGEWANITFGPDNDLVVWRSSSSALTVSADLDLPQNTFLSGTVLETGGYGLALDPSPLHGQVAILTDHLRFPNYTWRFRYNGDSYHAYRWEFIGGAPLVASSAASEPVSLVAWGGSGPTITLPVVGLYAMDIAGVYTVSAPARCGISAAAVIAGETPDVDANGHYAYQPTLANGDMNIISFSRTILFDNVQPNTMLTLKFLADNACSALVSKRTFTVRPVRVYAS